ncbi:MAG: tetratricopeptide repeat protein [Gammaproteobacteria bacterium]
MKKVVFALFPLLFGLSACSQMPSRSQAPERAPQAAPASQPPSAQASGAEDALTPDVLYRLLVAEIAGQRGDLKVSVDNYVDAARLSRDPRVAERATRIAVYARDDAKALEAARLWADLEPDDMDAQQVVAALLVRNGKTDEALSHLERVVSASTAKGYKGYMLVTSLLSREKDKEAAMKVMGRLVERHQDNPDALYAYGHLALSVGKLEIARGAVDKVLKLRPAWTKAYILSATIDERQGHTNKALAQLREAVKRYPKNHDLRLYYARKLIDAKQLDAARTQFKVMLEQSPNDADALFAMGLLSLQDNDLKPAAGYFRRLIKTGQRVSEASYFMGQIAEARHQPKTAIRWYSVVREGQYYVEAQIRIAVLLAKSGKVKAAQARLHEIEPQSANMKHRLLLAEGEILRQVKHYREAFDLYTQALKDDPNDSDVRYARALTAEKLDRLDVLESDLKDIIKREPDNAQALNALGYTLADRTKRYHEALGYIQRALKLQPGDPAILDSMGWVQYRLGHLDQAAQYLRRAFSKMKDAEIGAHLGEVLWVSGKKAEARKVWNEALKSSPEHESLLKVIRRFTK